MGIDIEILKEKKIAPRFLEMKHLENLSEVEKIMKALLFGVLKNRYSKLK